MGTRARVDLTKAIEIVARGSSEDKHDHLLLRLSFPHEQAREEILSILDYKKKSIETEAALRLITPVVKKEFAQRVQSALEMPDTFDVATQSGWVKDVFFLPSGEIVGSPGLSGSRPIKGRLSPSARQHAAKFAVKGSLAEWQKLCPLAEGNSRLMMAIALAFVGPIGDLIGGDPPMIQLVGPAESGKSSIAIAAGSVWGEFDDRKRKVFIESWHNTSNNLEPVAAAHCGTFLVLDETGLVDESKNDNPYPIVKKTVMRLNRGIEKGRMDRTERRKWWMGVLSTSNLSLDDMATASGSKCPDPIRTRLIDVPLDALAAGAFEELHHCKSEREFSVEIQRMARENYGVAAKEFIKRLVKRRKTDAKLEEWLNELRERYRDYMEHRLDGGGRKTDRITESFATIYAAGCAAIDLQVLTWSRLGLRRALRSCEQAHFGDTVDEFRLEESQVLTVAEAWQSLTRFVQEHRKDFTDLRRGLPEKNPMEEHWGASKAKAVCIRSGGNGLEYLFRDLGDFFEAPIKIKEQLLSTLKQRKHLITYPTRLQVKRRLSTKKSDEDDGLSYVYAIRASAFNERRSGRDPREPQEDEDEREDRLSDRGSVRNAERSADRESRRDAAEPKNSSTTRAGGRTRQTELQPDERSRVGRRSDRSSGRDAAPSTDRETRRDDADSKTAVPTREARRARREARLEVDREGRRSNRGAVASSPTARAAKREAVDLRASRRSQNREAGTTRQSEGRSDGSIRRDRSSDRGAGRVADPTAPTSRREVLDRERNGVDQTREIRSSKTRNIEGGVQRNSRVQPSASNRGAVREKRNRKSGSKNLVSRQASSRVRVLKFNDTSRKDAVRRKGRGAKRKRDPMKETKRRARTQAALSGAKTKASRRVKSLVSKARSIAESGRAGRSASEKTGRAHKRVKSNEFSPKRTKRAKRSIPRRKRPPR